MTQRRATLDATATVPATTPLTAALEQFAQAADELDLEPGLRAVPLRAFDEVWRVAAERAISPRLAAHVLAVGRVAEATRMRGLYP